MKTALVVTRRLLKKKSKGRWDSAGTGVGEGIGKTVGMYKTFREMPIWRDATDVAESVHRLTDNLPQKEDYGFTSQIRRSALSISANIAEAFGRHHTSDKVNFYYMARGSLTETQSHLEYGKRVGYIEGANADDLINTLSELYTDINKVILRLRGTKR